MVQRNVLGDESQVLQFGYEVETEFYTYLNKMPEPSAWNKFPTTEKPLTRYKFTSVEVNFSLDEGTIQRQTYSMLDWLGDMGGLLDALYFIAMILISPI